MGAAIDILLIFAVLFTGIFGLGCAIAASHPRCKGRHFLVNTFCAAAALTTAFGCAWILDGRLGW